MWIVDGCAGYRAQRSRRGPATVASRRTDVRTGWRVAQHRSASEGPSQLIVGAPRRRCAGTAASARTSTAERRLCPSPGRGRSARRGSCCGVDGLRHSRSRRTPQQADDCAGNDDIDHPAAPPAHRSSLQKSTCSSIMPSSCRLSSGVISAQCSSHASSAAISLRCQSTHLTQSRTGLQSGHSVNGNASALRHRSHLSPLTAAPPRSAAAPASPARPRATAPPTRRAGRQRRTRRRSPTAARVTRW
jgi:hypothetical protein